MDDEKWMKVAVGEAEKAMENGELPFGAVLVADGEEVARAQTRVTRDMTTAAHAETRVLFEAGNLYDVEHPLVLYTNVEPCLMCLATATRCFVDRVVYALPAGDAENTEILADTGAEELPRLEGGVLEPESRELFERVLRENPEHFAADYAHELLDKEE
ncbi:MAG: nucleoside deaminase [Candidatus Nanosalina sp.]